MSFYSGKFARVRINGVTNLASVKWTLLSKVEEVDDSSFEDAPFTRVRPALKSAELTIDGFWEEDIHQNPPDLSPGQYITVELFPDAIQLPGRRYYFPLVLVCSLSIDAEVRGIVKYTLSGKSDGAYAFFDQNVTVNPNVILRVINLF